MKCDACNGRGRLNPLLSPVSCHKCNGFGSLPAPLAPAPLPVTNIAAKRNAQWLEGAEHGRKAERDRILAVLRAELDEYRTRGPGIDEQLASESRRFVAEVIAEIERS